MKGKILKVLGVAAIAFLMVACGSNGTKEASNSSNSGKAEVENHYFVDGKELTEEEYKAYLEEKEKKQAEIASIEEHQKETTDKEEAEIENYLDIYKGDIFTLSGEKNELEITFNGVDFQQEVESKSDNMYRQYFADKEGESYIVMKLNIKNIGGDRITDDIFDGYNSNDRTYNKISLVVDNKYNYDMQQLDTESPVMSKYWSLEPLKEQEVYFIQSLPDEITDKPYTITFSLNDSKIICRYTKE